ncbi:MAG: hypothetical protein NZ561_04130 [Phycisphaerae bacterium]|nr:hypothetical protein [Phycisphaerae bacterium]MDW8262806.1 hypothetical protein [Phycisphaerales bacterium]
MNTFPPSPSLARLLTLVGLLTIPLASGCATRPAAGIRLHRLEDSHRLTQSFSNAYFSSAQQGAYDIVLVEQTEPKNAPRDSRKPTSPLASPLTHVMHVRVLWKPKKAIRADSPTATNASVNWSVMTADGTSRIDYEGVGFANVYREGEDRILVRLSNVVIRPSGKSEGLGDPIGTSRLVASFKAQRDPRMVRSMLAMARPQTASAQGNSPGSNPDAPGTVLATPPARPPTP